MTVALCAVEISSLFLGFQFCLEPLNEVYVIFWFGSQIFIDFLPASGVVAELIYIYRSQRAVPNCAFCHTTREAEAPSPVAERLEELVEASGSGQTAHAAAARHGGVLRGPVTAIVP